MTTYLDLLSDDLYIKIFKQVNKKVLDDAAVVGKRRSIPKKGKKTNQMVIWNWMNGKSFKSLRMSTNGTDLYSYSLLIGKTVNNKKILFNYTARGLGYYSQTTSQHVNLARPYSDYIVSDSDSYNKC